MTTFSIRYQEFEVQLVFYHNPPKSARKKKEKKIYNNILFFCKTAPMWIRVSRVIKKVFSLGSKGPEFSSLVRPSVVRIANHC